MKREVVLFNLFEVIFFWGGENIFKIPIAAIHLSLCTFIVDILYCYLWKASQKWNYGTILSTSRIFFYLTGGIQEQQQPYCRWRFLLFQGFSHLQICPNFSPRNDTGKKKLNECILTYTTYSDLYREGQVCWKIPDDENGSSLFRLQRSHIDHRVTVVRWPLAL